MDDRTRQATRLWTLALPAVSAFVTSVVRDFRDQDDVLQEVAIAVIESFEKYDSQRPFVAWTIGIARNQVGLYLRRRRRDRLVFDESTIECLATAFAEVTSEQTRSLDFLSECLKSLEGRPRKMCELRYCDDFKPVAIAERIGMTPNSVPRLCNAFAISFASASNEGRSRKELGHERRRSRIHQWLSRRDSDGGAASHARRMDQ